ncbi:hypothetical protein GP486_002062 [Trichoglossum hirsutum]|uniref:CCHC-type domain-containing protein n=1 Tax=Trichoglossum hirsutum TaxID=265104 RepID=A0A9P8LFN1_9PEZI|nr:hypothetical protein GP486_002062 [Trichoglossum hirsutum]
MIAAIDGKESGWNAPVAAARAGNANEGATGVVIGDRPDITCRNHSKTDCTNPRVETRTCKYCQDDGHIAKDCPTKPPLTCNNCKQEGHTRTDCKNNRAMNWDGVLDKTPEEAWEMLKTASAERDLFDFKAAVMIYVKALPATTYKDLEEAFRGSDFSVYLIAIVKEVMPTSTLMNLQGKIDCKYAVTYQFSAKPRRESERAAWPASPEENLIRLEDAGVVTDRHVPLCSNCERKSLPPPQQVPRLCAYTSIPEELGHISRNCPEERRAPVQPEIKCVNCDEVGHRARDCPHERKREVNNNCRNCK